MDIQDTRGWKYKKSTKFKPFMKQWQSKWQRMATTVWLFELESAIRAQLDLNVDTGDTC